MQIEYEMNEGIHMKPKNPGFWKSAYEKNPGLPLLRTQPIWPSQFDILEQMFRIKTKTDGLMSRSKTCHKSMSCQWVEKIVCSTFSPRPESDFR